MSKAVSGYPYYTSQAWKHLLQAIPSSFTVWEDTSTTPSTYRAECNVAGGADCPGATDLADILDVVLAALPTNGSGGKTGTVYFRDGHYLVGRHVDIPLWSMVTFIGESFESSYWGVVVPESSTYFSGGVLFDFTGDTACIKTTRDPAPPPGHTGLTNFLHLENIHIRISSTNAVTAINGDGLFSCYFKNVLLSYNLANKNWQTVGVVAGSIGIDLGNNGLNERMVFDHVLAYGFDVAYKFGCDHINANAMEAAYCTYGIEWTAGCLINQFTYFHALRCRYGIHLNGFDPQIHFGVLEIEWNGTMPWADGWSFKFTGANYGEAITVMALIDNNAAPFARYASAGSLISIFRDFKSNTAHFSSKMAFGRAFDESASDAAIFIVGGGDPTHYSAIGQDASDYLIISGYDLIKIKTESGAAEMDIVGGEPWVQSVGKGIVVKTPDGTKTYRISVNNAGNVITTLL